MSKHECHIDICDRAVPPKMLFCLEHWRMTPKVNQAAIWATYRPGQEVDKHPSREYLVAQRDARIAVLRRIADSKRQSDETRIRATSALVLLEAS